MTKATWDNIELTDECASNYAEEDKTKLLGYYRMHGWSPEQLLDCRLARVIETSREKAINWLRENTTREQWNNRDTLFFVGVNEPFTFDWETVPYDYAKGVCVIGYGKNKNAEPIHYQDVFEQPVFIDGAEYWLKDSSGHGDATRVRYMVGTNTFYEVDKPFGFSAPASDFGKHFTVELVSPLLVQQAGRASRPQPQCPVSLYDRVVKVLGNREVPIGGEDHLVGQVKVDHLKAVLLDKVVKEFNIPVGGDIIQWLHNRTNTQKKPEPVFFELANYLGFSGEFNEKEVLTEAFKTIRIMQEPDEFYNELRVIYGNPEATDNEILDDYRKCKNIVNAMTLPLIQQSGRVDRSKPRNKYDRQIIPGVYVDVYDVLQAFDPQSKAIDHAVKKLLAPGQRGVKDRITDLKEAISSIQREIDRIGEWSVSEDSE